MIGTLPPHLPTHEEKVDTVHDLMVSYVRKGEKGTIVSSASQALLSRLNEIPTKAEVLGAFHGLIEREKYQRSLGKKGHLSCL